MRRGVIRRRGTLMMSAKTKATKRTGKALQASLPGNPKGLVGDLALLQRGLVAAAGQGWRIHRLAVAWSLQRRAHQCGVLLQRWPPQIRCHLGHRLDCAAVSSHTRVDFGGQGPMPTLAGSPEAYWCFVDRRQRALAVAPWSRGRAVCLSERCGAPGSHGVPPFEPERRRRARLCGPRSGAA